MREIIAETSWRNRTATGASPAGLVNNLNDGLTWVIVPLLLVAHAVSVDGVGLIKALYPFLWAVGMLGTGCWPTASVAGCPRWWACGSRPPGWS